MTRARMNLHSIYGLICTKLDKEGKINFYSYGRVTKQVSRRGADDLGRLYYCYLDYRDVVKDHLDLRAGRTYVNAAAVSGTIDGLHREFQEFGARGVHPFRRQERDISRIKGDRRGKTP